MVLWLAPSPHSKRVPGGNTSWGLSVLSLHVLPLYMWVLPVYSSFLQRSKNMHVRLIGDTKLSLGVCVSVHGCLSLCGPVIDWRPVQGVPCLSPNGSGDRLQPPATLIGLSGYRKWMDELNWTELNLIELNTSLTGSVESKPNLGPYLTNH